MTTTVLYVDGWSDLTRTPRPGRDWIDAEAAQKRYAAREGLDVVDAESRDDDGLPLPRWALGFGNTGVRVQFFDSQMSIWRQVDWDLIDGRLWRWITYDWEYPDTTRHREKSEAILRAQSMVRPDGQGYIEVRDRRTGQELEAELEGHGSATYWLDWPEFGDWAALADPGPSPYEVAGREAPVRAS